MRWNSEAGHVTGQVVKVHTRDTGYRGHTHRCSVTTPTCPEVPWWHCRRPLIADVLRRRGIAVIHLEHGTRGMVPRCTSPAGSSIASSAT
ncbi:HVA1 family protein [Caenimonas terrae]|uniref:HVA1 family protein n=1 Tax=Caenimonas terrae TaxID=696074 RepID=A0ABW0N9E3_9BURK